MLRSSSVVARIQVATAWPCRAPQERAFRTRTSRVPWRRSSSARGMASPEVFPRNIQWTAGKVKQGPGRPGGRVTDRRPGLSYCRMHMATRDDAFTAARPLLFAIAYRMTGSVMDAEDLVQDAWLRWQEAPAGEVRAPNAYLTTIVTRLAINHLNAARTRRETYVGPWLPEPLVTDPAPDAAQTVELAESLSMAFLVLLERLAPVERAVLLLHEVVDFDHAAIARIVEKSEAGCRQILARAKRHLAAPEPRFAVDPARAGELLRRFTAVAADMALGAEGGGKGKGAASKPVRGATPVAKSLINGMRRGVPAGATIQTATLNGQPGLIASIAGRALAALIFDVRGDRIQTIYVVSNPDKLRGIRASTP